MLRQAHYLKHPVLYPISYGVAFLLGAAPGAYAGTFIGGFWSAVVVCGLIGFAYGAISGVWDYYCEARSHGPTDANLADLTVVIWCLVTVVGLVVGSLVGGIAWGFSSVFSSSENAESMIRTIGVVSGALFSGLLALWAQSTMLRPVSTEVDIEFDTPEYRPGDIVEATVSLHFHEDWYFEDGHVSLEFCYWEYIFEFAPRPEDSAGSSEILVKQRMNVGDTHREVFQFTIPEDALSEEKYDATEVPGWAVVLRLETPFYSKGITHKRDLDLIPLHAPQAQGLE